jgi:hypothetical protein
MIKLLMSSSNLLLPINEGRIDSEPTDQLVFEAASMLDSKIKVAPKLEFLVDLYSHLLDQSHSACSGGLGGGCMNLALVLIVDVIGFKVH